MSDWLIGQMGKARRGGNRELRIAECETGRSMDKRRRGRETARVRRSRGAEEQRQLRTADWEPSRAVRRNGNENGSTIANVEVRISNCKPSKVVIMSAESQF